MKILTVFLSALGVILLITLIGVPLALLNGWALSWLWLWFAVPLGVPAINVVHGMGLAGLVGLLTKQYNPTSEEGDKKYEVWAYAIVTPLITLGIGCLIQLFM